MTAGHETSSADQRVATHLFGGLCFSGLRTNFGLQDWTWPYTMSHTCRPIGIIISGQTQDHRWSIQEHHA